MKQKLTKVKEERDKLIVTHKILVNALTEAHSPH